MPVDLMRELDEEKQEEILSHIEDIEQAGDIVDLLKYDEDTAGGLMGTEMVVVNENWSMPECLKEMRQQAEQLDEIYYVYVIDDENRLQGVFPLKKMITSPSVSKVKHVMRKDPISVRSRNGPDNIKLPSPTTLPNRNHNIFPPHRPQMCLRVQKWGLSSSRV